MRKAEKTQIVHAIADLEALREFAPPPEQHKPKLQRAIERLRKVIRWEGGDIVAGRDGCR